MNDILSQLISQAEALTTELELEKAIKDPYYFLTRFCITMDEHWQSKGKDSPYQRIPEKEYIRDLCDVFQTEQLIAIEKTRQMMASWIFCGLALWDTMFKEGRRTFIMSKKEKDADALIQRIKGIYERLPQTVKDKYPRDPEKYLELRWSKKGSVIAGLAQGPDQIRSFTSTLVIMDEAAFQEKAEKAFEAIQPSLQGGGKFVAISTTNGRNWFWAIVSDEV